MPEGLVIRNGRVKDSERTLPVLDEFMNYHKRITTQDLDMVGNAGELWRKYFERHVRSRTRKAIVAEQDGEIVGFLLGELQKRPPILTTPRQAYVDSIGVVASGRNQGIGGMMLDVFTEWARQNKMPYIMLNVAVENDPAIRFYKKRGFETMTLSQRKLL
jgi:ribosomal protein S18 acetylase RimI-like enzyme